MDSILKLAPLIRQGTQHANGTSKSERHFLDFVVDGESLWKALGERNDMASILCAEYAADETAKAIGRLLLNGKADLPNDTPRRHQAGHAPPVNRVIFIP